MVRGRAIEPASGIALTKIRRDNIFTLIIIFKSMDPVGILNNIKTQINGILVRADVAQNRKNDLMSKEREVDTVMQTYQNKISQANKDMVDKLNSLLKEVSDSVNAINSK